MAKKKLDTTLDDADALEFFGVSSPSAVHQVARIAYVDDGLLPVLALAHQIVDELRRTASVVKFTYESYGLSINFAKGKTEATVAFHGWGRAAGSS